MVVMARLGSVEVSPKIGTSHKPSDHIILGFTQPSPSPNIFSGGTLNSEDKDGEAFSSSDGKSGIPSKKTRSKNMGEGNIWTVTNPRAVNKPGIHSKAAPRANMLDNSQDKDDREEEEGIDMARTINTGLSGKDPPEIATKHRRIARWSGLVGGLGKGVGGLLGFNVRTAAGPAPKSNISRKRAIDISEQTFAHNTAPNADGELAMPTQVTVAPKQLQRPSHIYRELDNLKTSSGRGKVDPYDDLHEPPSITTTVRASKVSGRGRKAKGLVVNHKSRPEPTTSRDIMVANRESPHKVSSRSNSLISENGDDENGQSRLPTQKEQSKQVAAIISAANPAKRVTRSNNSKEIVEPNDFSRRPERSGVHFSTPFKKQPSVGSREPDQNMTENERPRKSTVHQPSAVEALSLGPAGSSSPRESHVAPRQQSTDTFHTRTPQPPIHDSKYAERGDNGCEEIQQDPAGSDISAEDAANSASSIMMSSSPTKISEAPIIARQKNSIVSEPSVAFRSSMTREDQTGGFQNKNMRSSQYNSESEVIEKQDGSDSPKSLIDDVVLMKMLEIVRLVGKFKVNGMYKRVRPKIKTEAGQDMKHTTAKITSIYRRIKEFESSEEPDREAIEKQHDSAVLLLEDLESKSSDILVNWLGDASGGGHNAIPKSRLDILKDLYFHVFAGLVVSLDAAVHAYRRKGQISSSDLGEVLRILNIVIDLLAAAAAEKKKPNPKDYRGIYKPMRSLGSIVRHLCKDCNDEIQARAAAIKAAAYEQAAPERKRQREERELAGENAEEEAYQERLSKRRRDAGASWKRQMDLGFIPSSSQRIAEPLLSQQSRAPSVTRVPGSKPLLGSQFSLTERRVAIDQEAARLESELQRVKQEARGLKRAEERLRQVLTGVSSRSDGGSIRDINEEGDEERLHMFGENNTAASATIPWNDIEMETLVDGLRQHRGRDRYEIIASRLERSYDEIFAKAREFKVAIKENMERKRRGSRQQQFLQLEDWIDCIGMEF